MKLSRCLAAWVILTVAWVSPLYALNTADVSIHRDRLWRLAAQEQAMLEQSGIILHDASLSSYLQKVTTHLWGQVKTDLKTPVVEVIMDTRMEAYAYPNGYFVLTTGLLNQIENEDQLAMILAHEIIHYMRQHTAELYDHYQHPFGDIGLQYAEHRQEMGANHVKQQIDVAEYQADSEGLSLLRGAGYCELEILSLLSNLMDSISDHGTPEALKNMASRLMLMQTLIDQDQSSPSCTSTNDNDSEFFINCIAPTLMANAQVALRRGDWNQADRSISKFMVLKPRDARAYYLQGEIMRRRNDGDDKGHCIGFFEEALKIDPEQPLSHRALGEIHFKAGRYQLAKPHFEAFLSLVPQDDAKEYIKGYLRQCQN